mgnify:CR=1 FL=1
MDYTKQEFMAITTGREIKDGELIAVDGHLGSVLRVEVRGGVT